MSRPKLLLVDDNPALLEVYGALLECEGYECTRALGANEAKQRVEAPDADYGVVLLDMDMPEMTGVELAQHWNSLFGASRSFTLVALTSHALPDQIESALGAGCDGYIVKPSDPSELMSELTLLLASK